MKHIARSRDIVQALQQQVATPEPPERGVFWETFQAHAALVPQQRDAAQTVGHSLWRPLYLAAYATAAIVLAIAVLRHGPFAAESTPRLSKVSELDVYMDYSSVMIVEDQQNHGTVIWMASATTTNGG